MGIGYKERLDVRKDVKNISVRYVSSIMPTVDDMDNYIVLSLFQREQDIPIDDDGRKAILLVHVPSLEKLLDLWKEKTAKQETSENLRYKKGEKINAHHERVHADTFNLSSTIIKKEDTFSEVDDKFNESAFEREQPFDEYETLYECFSIDDMDNVGAVECVKTEMPDCSTPLLYGTGSLIYGEERALDLGIHDEELVSNGEDWTLPQRSGIFSLKQVVEPREEPEMDQSPTYAREKEPALSRTKQDLSRHVAESRNVDLHSKGRLQCDMCWKTLKYRTTLMKHKRRHLGVTDMKCYCSECGRPFKNKRALIAHTTRAKHMLVGCVFT